MASSTKYRKKKLGSYPYLLVLFSLIFSLTIIGFWGSILIIGNELQLTIKENINVQVYLQKEVAEDSIVKIQKRIENRPYVLKKTGIIQVQYISKAASSKKFIEETGENFADFMGENPLRDAFIVKIDPRFSRSSQLKVIKEDLSSQDGIFEVVYTESLAESIHDNIQKLSLAAVIFSSIMVLVIFLLINNTIKLAMYSQRFLIRSMQLVGARAWFIQKPYLFRSFWLGLLGGLIAAIIMSLSINYGMQYLPEIKGFLAPDKLLMLIGALILGGGIICLLSSVFAVSRYLGRSLEDLY